MFGLMDSNERVIAFHRERRVIEKFQELYYNSNDEWLQMFHIKKKAIKKYKDYEDLYLVRYGDIYVQSKYLYVMQLDVEPLLDDLYCAHDVMIRMIEFMDDDKKCKQIIKALNLIDEEIEKYKNTIPKVSELENRDSFYSVYRNGGYV